MDYFCAALGAAKRLGLALAGAVAGVTTIVLAGVTLATPAAAYLDPGTGSILLQGVLGSFALLAAFIGSIRHKIAGLFSVKVEDADELEVLFRDKP